MVGARGWLAEDSGVGGASQGRPRRPGVPEGLAMLTICAWCMAERAAQGLPPKVISQDAQPSSLVSHGLCKGCAAKADSGEGA